MTTKTKSGNVTPLRKPMLNADAVLSFAEAAGASVGASTIAAPAKSAPGSSQGSLSGLVPSGDVRLTANIRQDLHLKLKIRAAQERTTVGELIEQWVSGWEK